ncbi:MAG TPA: hypothetical protein VHL11_02250, partial [Phototrophicaceae bacterium]|nr:hypothetical protein [Phototrophicaceae bacterium]
MAVRQILLLGSPRIEHDGQRITIGRRKALALLAYLVTTRDTFSREALAAMFWTDAELSRGLAYLRTTLWTLNQALGDDWAVVEEDTLRFNIDAGIIDDVSRFKHLLTENTPEALNEAWILYRNDFLAGFTLPDTP